MKNLSYRSDLLNDLKNDAGYAAKYLSAAIADSREAFLVALRDVAEANKMARVAEEANVNRESLYRTLSKEGNPTLTTLSAVLDAMGLQIAVAQKQSETSAAIPPTPVPMQAEANTSVTIVIGTGHSSDVAGACTNVLMNSASSINVFVAGELIGEQIPNIPLYMLGAQISQRQEARQG